MLITHRAGDHSGLPLQDAGITASKKVEGGQAWACMASTLPFRVRPCGCDMALATVSSTQPTICLGLGARTERRTRRQTWTPDTNVRAVESSHGVLLLATTPKKTRCSTEWLLPHASLSWHDAMPRTTEAGPAEELAIHVACLLRDDLTNVFVLLALLPNLIMTCSTVPRRTCVTVVESVCDSRHRVSLKPRMKIESKMRDRTPTARCMYVEL